MGKFGDFHCPLLLGIVLQLYCDKTRAGRIHYGPMGVDPTTHDLYLIAWSGMRCLCSNDILK